MQSPNLNSKTKDQKQDDPTSSYGRYGMYRALLSASSPKLKIRNSVGNAALGGGFASLRKGPAL